MKNAFVECHIENHIAKICFGTPKSNSMPAAILEKLSKTILECGQDQNVKVILLKSDGEKAFCAGASFDELLEITDIETSKAFFGGFAKVVMAMKNCGKIVVVRVQGKTTGGGVGIACAGDYCFGTNEASIALTELNIGIGPFVIGPFVERKIGTSAFTAMALDTGFRNAEWAKNHQVYQEIYPTMAEMDVQVEKFIRFLAQKSSDALSLLKKVSWEGTEHFEKLMPERILMSAQLILKDEAKNSLMKVKQQLNNK